CVRPSLSSALEIGALPVAPSVRLRSDSRNLTDGATGRARACGENLRSDRAAYYAGGRAERELLIFAVRLCNTAYAVGYEAQGQQSPQHPHCPGKISHHYQQADRRRAPVKRGALQTACIARRSRCAERYGWSLSD